VLFNTLDRAIIEGETGGFARLITTPSGRLLGAHIIGPGAGEIAGALVLLVRDGALLQELADVMFPYPTLGEILHRAGNEIYREMLSSTTAKAALKLLVR
jgi:pyruvate/2-oxoglutarate dehydrogenase complex dihydrolipoamide dehydrogenase (E3) component